MCPASRTAPSVLVADDDPGVRKLVRITLELEGYSVTTVLDGPSAIDALRGSPHDVVVLDVMMPGLDGIETCRVLKCDPLTWSTPVILLSAKAQASDVEKGLGAGADRYMTKPFEPLDLVETIENLLPRS